MGSDRNSVPLNNCEHPPTRNRSMSLMEKNKETKKNVVVKIRPIVSISIPKITRLEVIQEL